MDTTPDVEQVMARLRDQFPGWRIQYLDSDGRRGLPWDARVRHLRPPGGFAHLVAADPEELREMLTTATVLNTRHLGRWP